MWPIQNRDAMAPAPPLEAIIFVKILVGVIQVQTLARRLLKDTSTTFLGVGP